MWENTDMWWLAKASADYLLSCVGERPTSGTFLLLNCIYVLFYWKPSIKINILQLYKFALVTLTVHFVWSKPFKPCATQLKEMDYF